MENKTSKYFKYAIGEIVLVVIGILIALSINNWNETIKIEKSKNIQLESLKEDLQEDYKKLILLDSSVSNELIEIESVFARLRKPSCTIDTLIKINRLEFEPYLHSHDGFKKTTYESLINTGEIKTLHNDLKKDLSELSIAQASFKNQIDEHFNSYLQTVQDHLSQFPTNNEIYPFSLGPLNKELWNNINYSQLLISYNKTMSTKKLYYIQLIGSIRYVSGLTQSILQTHFND